MPTNENTPVQPTYHTLIIDDEVDICFLLRSILAAKNTTVDCAHSIKAAREMMANHQPDIVFLDNFLPDGIGMEFISYTRASCPDAKIIMISAHDSLLNQQRALMNGAQKFLPKPFMVEDLDETIRNIYA